MKKLFISQPMRGKTDEEISAQRNEMIAMAGDLFGEVEAIESFFAGLKVEAKNKPLHMLGLSLIELAEADIAMFAPGWENARGCKLEHDCALAYGIDVIFDQW